MSKRQIAQELECNFNTSGETVIDPDCMKWLLENVKEPKHRTGFDRNFWIWEEFDPSCNYLAVADVSRGDGADYSTMHMIKLETLEIVGEYQGKPTPDMYANFLNQVGREFGNAMLVVENNNIGYTVLDKLVEYTYPNLYYSVKSTHEYIEQYQAEAINSAVAGFTTSMKTRPLIIAKLEEFIRNKLITIYSSRTINEMKTFIWKNGKPQAMKGYHDDLIMALAIACWVRDTALQSSARDLNYSKAFLSSIVTSKTSMNTQIKGQQGYKKDNIFDKMSEAQQMYDQFSWIIK
jgi:predicted chitinase